MFRAVSCNIKYFAKMWGLGYMNYKRFASLAGAVLLTALSLVSASAETSGETNAETSGIASVETNVQLVQGYVSGEYLDLFLSNELVEDSLSIKVANRETEFFDAGKLAEEEIAVKTTILIDNSTSMPSATRAKVGEFLDFKIKNIAKNEEIKIVQFGDEITTLQEFTNDRYDLDKAADLIKYDGQESKIFDAIYNTIPEISALDDEPCFYRTIVITDGVDLAAQGITKEELFIRLQSDTYPIDVLCVTNSKTDNENKDLSALTRMSNGRYFDIYPESDAFALVSDVSVSDYFWVRTKVPVSLLDGSTRQIDVSDRNVSVSFDMKMSVVDAPPVEPIESEVVESKVESTVSVVVFGPSEPPVEESDNSIDITTLVIIAAGVGVAAVVAIIIIALVKKKKRSTDDSRFAPQNPVTPSNGTDETELIDGSGNGEQYAIRISNTANPSESWILNVTSDVIIGRADGCTIQINEKSVSREQCKISLKSTGLVLSNLSSSNPTKLNGTTVTGEMLLHPADNIHFGRITLRVDYIQKIGEEPIPAGAQDNIHSGGETESIF